MQRACRALVGRHDFASFVASAETARQKQTVRDVFKAEITQDGDMIVLEMVANSFLPHQVRNTVGSLIKVGQGKMTVEEFESIVAGKDTRPCRADGSGRRAVPGKVDYPGPFEGDAR